MTARAARGPAYVVCITVALGWWLSITAPTIATIAAGMAGT